MRVEAAERVRSRPPERRRRVGSVRSWPLDIAASYDLDFFHNNSSSGVAFTAVHEHNGRVQPGDRIHLLGIGWTNGSPYVRLRQNGGASQLVPLATISLRYSIDTTTTRRCVGHKPFRDKSTAWSDCNRTPSAGSLTCDRCTASDATFASQLHHAHTKGPGELDSAVLHHLQQPNNVYLAAFRDGSIKVGTSTKARLDTRLDEQGAWVAQVVATTTDGFAVRLLEDRITAELGLPQSVSVSRKLDGLDSPRPDDRLRTELSRWSTRVHELVAEQADPRVAPTNAGWVSSISTNPAWNNVHRYPLKLNSGAHDLDLLTASGRIAMAQRPTSSDRFVCDLKQLFGREIELLDEVVPDELSVQDKLF